MGPETRVRFADGFERPERIAFGLEAPQLALVVVGSLLAWSLYHGPTPLAVRAPLALLVGAGSAALGWGRWQERPLLTWAWLALRFAVLPRSGGGSALLDAVTPDTGAGGGGGDGGDPGPSSGPPATPAGAPPPEPPQGREPRRPREAIAAAVRGRAAVPAWMQWIDPPQPSAKEPTEASQGASEPHRNRGELGDLEFGTATHALITGRRRVVLATGEPGVVAPARERVVLIPSPGAREASPTGRARTTGIPATIDAGPALAPVLPLRAADAAAAAEAFAPLELDDRAEPKLGLLRPRPHRHMRRVGVFALSGGGGRTTIAVEAACLVAAGGLRVAILDLDVPAPGVALRLGLPHPERWHPALLGGDGITSLDDLLVTHRSGARVLAGPTSTVAPEVILPARVAELLHLLEQAGTALVLVDLPGDLGALSVTALGAMDEILVVVTPTPRGAQDAYRSTEALRRLGLGPRLRYVVNRARQGDDLNEVIGDLAGEVAATIPFDADLEAGEATHRLAGLDGGGAAASAVRRLAAGLLGAPATAAAGGPGPDPRWG